MSARRGRIVEGTPVGGTSNKLHFSQLSEWAVQNCTWLIWAGSSPWIALGSGPARNHNSGKRFIYGMMGGDIKLCTFLQAYVRYSEIQWANSMNWVGL